MDNQHRKITGYRELTQDEINLMNEVKALGSQIQAVFQKVKQHIEHQKQTVAQRIEGAEAQQAEFDRLNAAEPEKWINWASDSAQPVLMYAIRAIAQPTTF